MKREPMTKLILRPAVVTGWAVTVLLWTGLAPAEEPTVEPLRLLVVGGFLLAAPGLVLVWLLRLTDPLAATVVAGGASLVLLTSSAQVALYTGSWEPTGVVLWICGLTLAGSVALAARAVPRKGGGPVRSTAAAQRPEPVR